MIYGYTRCSTNEELQDISRQVRELKQQGAAEDSIYREYMSGAKENRPELTKLLNAVKPGDTIVATEVSEGMLKMMGAIRNTKYKYLNIVEGTT